MKLGHPGQGSLPLASHIRDALSDLCSKMSSLSWVYNYLAQKAIFQVMKHLHLQPDSYIAYVTFSRKPCPINPQTLGVFTISNPKPETLCQKQSEDMTSLPHQCHQSIHQIIYQHFWGVTLYGFWDLTRDQTPTLSNESMES